LEEIEVDGRIILSRLFKLYWQEVKLTGLSPDGDNFSAFVITVLKIGSTFFFRRKAFSALCSTLLSP